MKQTVLSFRVGDRVQGRVTEQLSTGDLIISFEGDLLRVVNESSRRFRAGDFVFLTVAATQPLSFRLAAPQLRARATSGHFDIKV